ncbi:hypothetical protein Y1Q_0019481 [Alligator mississippiensis]|uniref:Uncharacterized protein n=1 Tax=Alligator mississippiensis TaxID=8496 RepID=A0A151NMJ4_ALLMI|nr:hypothetical protein Y1Q_0019481 [Alligator mississippiensis]
MNSTSGGVHVHIIGIHAGVWAAVAWYQGASDAMMDNVLPVSMDYFSVEEHHGKRKIMAFVLTFETSRVEGKGHRYLDAALLRSMKLHLYIN